MWNPYNISESVCVCIFCTVMTYSISCYHWTTFWIHGICSNVCGCGCVCACVCVCVFGSMYILYVCQVKLYCCFTPYVAGTTLLVNTILSCGQHSVAADRLTSKLSRPCSASCKFDAPLTVDVCEMDRKRWWWVHSVTSLPLHPTPILSNVVIPIHAMWCHVIPVCYKFQQMDCSILCVRYSESVMQNDGHYSYWHVA